MSSDTFRESLIAELPALRAYAAALVRSSTEADDLVQAALERAWRFQATFTPGTRIRPWLFTILRNTHTDAGRKSRRLVQDVDGQHAGAMVFEAEQHWRTEYAEMLNGLMELNGATRHALLLVLGLGLSYEEAALVCDCPVTTVKSRVTRGRDRLLQALAARDKPEP